MIGRWLKKLSRRRGEREKSKETPVIERTGETGEEERVRMKILVVSDTHGCAERLALVKKQVGEVDMLIHAGDIEGQEDYIRKLFDCPLFMVAGNNDWGSNLKRELTFRIDDYRFFVTHGHSYGVSLGTERLLDEAISRSANICIFGHTHYPTLFKRENVTMMNPGSIAYPRQVGRKPTYGIIEIDTDHIAHFSIGQLDKKI